ncbi:ankyrin repeat-containing domain protein, partial [Mycena maculata]
ASRLHDKLYKWLQSPPNTTSKQDEMQRLRHENTGSWFLNGPEFSEWKANPGSLWIRGNSGTGKSVLCSTVIREICTAADGKSSAVAYFYFDFTDDQHQRPDIMLRSIVFQLSAQSSHPYKVLGRLHNTLSDVPPHHEDLLKVLDEVLSELGRCYIVLDALDECNEAYFHRLVDFLKTLLAGPNKRPLHLLLTSQPRQIFMEEFHDLTLVELECGATENDIRNFVESGVSHLKIRATQAEQVTEQVVQKSSGMSVFVSTIFIVEFTLIFSGFRLATCLLKELDDCWSTEWEETLNSLPSDLYGIYDRFLKRVPSKRLIYVQAIFRWLLFAAHPVTLDELADAIAFNFSDPAELIYDPCRCKDNMSAIFKWLDGLILIKDRDYSWHPEPEPEKSVALAHASVQDYILSKQFTDKFAADKFHNHVSTISCTFLTLSILNSETFPNYPLSMYAANYWSHYVKQDGSGQYAALNHLHDFISIWPGHDTPDWNHSIPSPCILCSTIGYAEGVCFLLEKGANVDAVDGPMGTALQTAAYKGFTQIVGLLLDKEANLYPDTHATPLYLACLKGHMEVVQMLLEHGAIASAPEEEVHLVLDQVIKEGHIDILCLLLNNGVDANTTSNSFSSALHTACSFNQRQIIELLLSNGADINAVGGKYEGLLPAASAGGMLDIVQLFVDKGLDVNQIEGGKYSALQASSEAGHPEVVCFLLEKAAEVNTQGEIFGSALHAVSAPMPWSPLKPETYIAHLMDIAHLLLNNGADINTVGGKYGGLLPAASAGGMLEIVQLLVNKGLDANRIEAGKYSPLQAASEAGHPEVVHFLLESGAKVNAQGGKFGSLLQAAAAAQPNLLEISRFIESQTKVISLLLASGADPSSTGGKFGSALCATSIGGHHEIVTILLDHGTDVNLECGEFGSALQAASGPLRPKWLQTTKDRIWDMNQAELRQRRTKTVQVLLGKCVNVHTKFGKRGTALQIASRWGHADIIQALLESGANLDAGDDEHGTALQLVSRWGHADIVWILLEKGAAVDTKFGKCGTTFHMASRWDHQEIVEILREKGAHLESDVEPSLVGFWE